MAIADHRIEIDRRLRKSAATGENMVQRPGRQRPGGEGIGGQRIKGFPECRFDPCWIGIGAEHDAIRQHAACPRADAPALTCPLQRQRLAVAMNTRPEPRGHCDHAIGEEIGIDTAAIFEQHAIRIGGRSGTDLHVIP